MTIHKINGVTVRTHNVFPPIPVRSFDWSAVDDNSYDGEGCPIGYGPTEQAAISELMQMLEIE